MTSEKRNVTDAEKLTQEAILLDIEGTTTSISFVVDTLFPYVREFLNKHVDQNWDTDEFKGDLAKLKEQAKEDNENKIEGIVPIKEGSVEETKESVIKNVLWQMDNDRKTGALKQLQGHIWQAKYKPLKGHVYEDVPKAFDKWTAMGKKLYIYSSGSVQAQKLLFADTTHGDMLKYISGHFDTEVGPKQQAESYKTIAKNIGLDPTNIFFLTDIPKEADAAKAAGIETALVIREGNAHISDEERAKFRTIKSFAELDFETSNKRLKLENEKSANIKDVGCIESEKTTSEDCKVRSK